MPSVPQLLSLNRRIRSTARVEDFDDFTLKEAASNIKLMLPSRALGGPRFDPW